MLGLLQLVAVLLVVGVLLWGVTQLPIDPTIVRIVRVVLICLAAIWVIWWLLGLAVGPPYPVRSWH